MKVLSARQIQAISADPACCTRAFNVSSIDFSRPFLHECFTPLYYTPLYKRLSHDQRLRYNQLSGMKVNEQFMLLEREFTDRILTKLRRHPAVVGRPDLMACVNEMIFEEGCHADMFQALNRLCLPDIYTDTDRYFAKLGRVEASSIRMATFLYRQLTFLLWFLVAVEEYSVGLSYAMMRTSQTETLGVLESNFLRVHAEHVKDESRHVHIGALLIEACFSSASKFSRWVNAYLFTAFMDYVATPSSAVCVIRHLVKEHAELLPLESELVSGVMAVKQNEAFRQSQFNRTLLPHTFALLDAQPEFRARQVTSRGRGAK